MVRFPHYITFKIRYFYLCKENKPLFPFQTGFPRGKADWEPCEGLHLFMANQQFNERWKNTICGDKQGPLLAETPQTHDGMRWSSWQGMSHSTTWGDGGGGVVPTHTWHRDKRDERTQGHWPGWTLTPPLKTHLGKNPLEKRKNFEDDVNFDSLHF